MKPASRDLKNEAITAAMLAISEAHDGLLAPAIVVDAARDPFSPLHDEFEWDDDAAAEGYRLAQAGALIRRVRLHVIKQNPKTKKVTATMTRQFQSRPSQRSRDRGYETVQDIMADEEKRAELIEQVVHELRAYRKRYAELFELAEIWAAIDATERSSESSDDDRPSAPAA